MAKKLRTSRAVSLEPRSHLQRWKTEQNRCDFSFLKWSGFGVPEGS
jgi:hypothetical protein